MLPERVLVGVEPTAEAALEGAATAGPQQLCGTQRATSVGIQVLVVAVAAVAAVMPAVR